MIDLSIIVTNFNGAKVIEDCLVSIYEKTSGIIFEVIVVDDASKDNSAEIVRTKYPHVKLIQNPKNLFFSEANNVGIKNSRGRYIVLLNNDTIIQNNAFGILVKYMDSNPDVGIAGGTLLNREGTNDISYGSFPTICEAIQGIFFLDQIFPGLESIKIKGRIPSGKVTENLNVDYICGADIMIRRGVIEEIGLLDSTFKAYCEETDFCYRIKKSGKWRIVYVPEARIVHLFGGTWVPGSQRKVQLLYSSYDRFLRKHHGYLYAVIVRLLYAFRYSIIFLFNLLRSKLSGGNSEKFISRYREAMWIVRYSLFPLAESE